jgi:glycosyltransferase involved in cell wall biosynthesis
MISVIIPLYNKELIIEKSLHSVLSQDYDDFEVVIVNDGSTDKSAEIVKRIEDSRIRLIEQENGGPSKARNTGVKNAKGDWIVFLDADDEFLPRALSIFAGLIEQNSFADFLSCSYYVRTVDGRIIPHDMRDEEVTNNFKSAYFYRFHTRTGIAVYRKQLVFDNPFDEHIKRFEDFDVWYRMYRTAKVYTSSQYVLIENQKYAEASNTRMDIGEDFLGHLSFNNKCFWEKMCLYQLFLAERERYGIQCKALYPWLYKRYDILLIHHVLQVFSKLLG